MKRFNAIYNSDTYQKAMLQNENWERERSYCKHGLTHQLDVARIAYIMVLENGLDVSKEVVYATAFLHDIGRHLEYEGEMPHHEASARIARDILYEVGYLETEILLILETIVKHREVHEEMGHEYQGFINLFYFADKLSRTCFKCQVSETCKWTDDRKNHEIIV